MIILPSTILLNVGISSSNLNEPNFRTGREGDGGQPVSKTAFALQVRSEAEGLQERISASYFDRSVSDEFVCEVTTILSSRAHAASAVSRGFLEKLGLLVAHLGLLYEHNEILALNLIQFQDYLNGLANVVSREDSAFAKQFSQEIDGLRLANSEQVSVIIQNIELIQKHIHGAEYLALAGDETLALEQFRALFEEFAFLKVLELRPRNSPVAVFIEILLTDIAPYVAIASLIVGTRFKREFSNPLLLSNEQDSALKEIARTHLQEDDGFVPANQELVPVNQSLEIGRLAEDKLDFGVRISNSFQSGLIKNYQLDFSPKRAVDFHKKLFGLIGVFSRAAE